MNHATRRHVLGAIVFIACGTLSCEADVPDTESVESAARVKDRFASATIKDASGAVLAVVTFRAERDGETAVSVVASLAPAQEGFHGLHVHANDNPANGVGCVADPAQPAATHFVSADGHLTLPGNVHGDHVGDMPVLMVRGTGRGSLSFTTDRFKVSDVIGRAIILHVGPDNYHNVPVGAEPNQYTPNSPAATALTDATGNAGPRLGCGVIK